MAKAKKSKLKHYVVEVEFYLQAASEEDAREEIIHATREIENADMFINASYLESDI